MRLEEIMYRYQGYSGEEAHLRARVDEAIEFCGDPRWHKYFEEFPDSTLPRECLERLCDTRQRGVGEGEILYRQLLDCVEKATPPGGSRQPGSATGGFIEA